MATATVDPVRAQVEATLRHLVDSVAAVPCDLVRRSRDAAGRAADRVSGTVTTSVALARSMSELAFGGLLGIGRSAVAPSSAQSRSAPATSSSGPETAVGTTPQGSADRADSAADHLALGDYESLAASHVVARLARLSADELVQIREFEEANRGRRTILGKIEQLLRT
jgi:hypothetical protein